MRKWNGMAILIVGLGFLLTETPAQALITALTPLQKLLEDSTFIVIAKIESVDADKPAMVVVVDKDLKAKSPLRRLPILLKGDAEAKKKNHVPLILKRIAPNLPLVLFIRQQEKKFTAFGYTQWHLVPVPRRRSRWQGALAFHAWRTVPAQDLQGQHGGVEANHRRWSGRQERAAETGYQGEAGLRPGSGGGEKIRAVECRAAGRCSPSYRRCWWAGRWPF